MPRRARPICQSLMEGSVVTSYANIVLCLLAVGAGLSSAVQQILNANLKADLGSPWWAGLVSFATGTLVMFIVAVLSGSPWSSGAGVQKLPLVSWAGGVFGAIFIGTTIVLTPRLGVAAVLALIVVGQMLGGLVFDHVGLLGIPQHPATAVRILGAIVLIVGAVMIGR